MVNHFLKGNLPAAIVQQIIALLAQISTFLPFLMSLTPEERKALPTVSDGRLPYVLKLVEYSKKHRAKIGMAQEDLDDLTYYAQLFDDLSTLLSLVEDLRTGLRDTKMQTGAILYRLSRAGNAQIEVAYAKGKPGLEYIIVELAKLFANQGGSGPDEDLDAQVVIDEPKDSGSGGGAAVIPA